MTVTAGLDLSIAELEEVASLICKVASDDATIVIGAPVDSEITSGELRVTLVATGLGNEIREKTTSFQKPKRTGQIDYSSILTHS